MKTLIALRASEVIQSIEVEERATGVESEMSLATFLTTGARYVDDSKYSVRVFIDVDAVLAGLPKPVMDQSRRIQ
jgi:hypothetical protein